MPSSKKRYDAKRRKDAISLLKAFSEKIKNGEVDVETCNMWPGMEGKYNLKLVVKIVEIPTVSE
jgi:hypothetical protein